MKEWFENLKASICGCNKPCRDKSSKQMGKNNVDLNKSQVTEHLATGGLELAAHVTCDATQVDEKFKAPDPNIPNGTQS